MNDKSVCKNDMHLQSWTLLEVHIFMQNCIKVQKTAINAVINVDFFRILLYNKVVKEILNSINIARRSGVDAF